MKLTFVWNIFFRIVNFLVYFLFGTYFVLIGILAPSWYVSVLFYVLSFVCFVILLFKQIIKRRVVIEETSLILCYLNKKRKIDLTKVLWYAKNAHCTDSLFCKSKKNICLFYEGKKECISVKEIDVIENILIQNGIKEIPEEEGVVYKQNTLSPLICLCILNATNIYLGNIEYSIIKMFAQYCMLALSSVFLVLSLIELFAFSKLKSKNKKSSKDASN